MSFDDLPNEMILNICNELDDRSLLEFAKSSSRFNSVCRDLIDGAEARERIRRSKLIEKLTELLELFSSKNEVVFDIGKELYHKMVFQKRPTRISTERLPKIKDLIYLSEYVGGESQDELISEKLLPDRISEKSLIEEFNLIKDLSPHAEYVFIDYVTNSELILILTYLIDNNLILDISSRNRYF